MKIHCSKASAALIKEQAPQVPLKSRGKIQIKGKELMSTYWVYVGHDVESGDFEDYGEAEDANLDVSFRKTPVPGELVTLSELAQRAKKAGTTLADFPNTFGARTLSELLSRGPRSEEEIKDDDSTDFFLQSHQDKDGQAQIEKLRHEVAARLGVRIAP
jgi:hypothetical protein